MDYITDYNDDIDTYADDIKASKAKRAKSNRRDAHNTKRNLNYARYAINSGDDIDWDSIV